MRPLNLRSLLKVMAAHHREPDKGGGHTIKAVAYVIILGSITAKQFSNS